MDMATAQKRINETIQILLESDYAGDSMKTWLEELEGWGKTPQDIIGVDIVMEFRLKPTSTKGHIEQEPTGLKVITLTYGENDEHFRVFNEKWEHVTVKEWVR